MYFHGTDFRILVQKVSPDKIKFYTKGLRLALDKIRIITIVISENTACCITGQEPEKPRRPSLPDAARNTASSPFWGF